jgi:hypothetical protein
MGVLVATFLSASVSVYPAVLRLGTVAGAWCDIQSPTQAVVIDGSKNPELFPEWYVWERVFEWLPSGATPPRGGGDELQISTTNYSILAREVKAYHESKQRLERELKERTAAFTAQGRTADQIDDAQRALEMEYRYRILDGRARVYRDLPSPALQNLRAWANERLRGVSVHLRGRTAGQFRLPW